MAYQKKKPENVAYKKLLADLAADTLGTAYRSEERRVGKECRL